MRSISGHGRHPLLRYMHGSNFLDKAYPSTHDALLKVREFSLFAGPLEAKTAYSHRTDRQARTEPWAFDVHRAASFAPLMEIEMSSPTARKLKRRHEQHETTTAKKPPVPVMDSADGIATGSVLTDNSHIPAKTNSHGMSGGAILDSEREKLVREAAYFRAEQRGFAPGGELEDWVASEREVDQLLMARKTIPVGFVG